MEETISSLLFLSLVGSPFLPITSNKTTRDGHIHQRNKVFYISGDRKGKKKGVVICQG